MARFYATVKGQGKTIASRLGGKKSGITTSTNGWTAGVDVYGSAHGEVDIFEVFATSGSSGGKSPRHLFTIRALPDGEISIETIKEPK